MLQAYEGVVAADTGHIASHEAGAVEYTGHKVLTIPHKNGKIPPEVLNAYLKGFFEDSNHEHMVFPGMVYISHPTEYGTLYTRSELERISSICKEYQIPLFLDGARLGLSLIHIFGPYMTVAAVWNIADIFNALMAFPNLIALLALNGVVVKETKDYFQRHPKRN